MFYNNNNDLYLHYSGRKKQVQKTKIIENLYL